MAKDALDSLQSGVDHAREQAPSAIARLAARVEEVGEAGLERARDVREATRAQLQRANGAAQDYIREEPVKAVLIAAASGAVLAGLLGWALRSRRAA